MGILRRGSRLAFALAAFLVAFGVLPLSTRTFFGEPDARVLVVILVGLDCFNRFAVGRSGPRALWSWGQGVLGILMALLSVAAMAGTMRPSDVAAAQGAHPWQWLGLGHPVGFLAAFSILALLAEPGASVSRSNSQVATILDQVTLFLWSNLLTVCFFGGWLVPFLGPEPLQGPPFWRVLAAFVFCAKASVVMFVIVQLRKRPHHRTRFGAVLLAFSALALAGLLVWFGPLAELNHLRLPIFLALTGSVAVLLVHSALRWRQRYALVLTP